MKMCIRDRGGNDQAIVVIGRESGSGTRSAFEELLEIEDACKYAQEVDSTGGCLLYTSPQTQNRQLLDGQKMPVSTMALKK